jgi:hypothetical protein
VARTSLGDTRRRLAGPLFVRFDAFFSFGSGSGLLKQFTTRHLFEYWDELRDGRSAPRREALDPRAMRSVLANTFLLEADEHRRFPMPVVGSRLGPLLRDVRRNASFIDQWAPRSRDTMLDLLEVVQLDVQPVIAGVTISYPEQEPCVMELLLLPLRQNGRTTSRILGGLFPATFPAWYGLVPPGPLELGVWRIVDPAYRERLRGQVVTPQMRRNQLILIEGGVANQAIAPETVSRS